MGVAPSLCSRRAAYQGGDFLGTDGQRDPAVVAGHSPNAALVKICWKVTIFVISRRGANGDIRPTRCASI